MLVLGLGLYPKYHLQHRNTRINPAALPDEKVREVFPNYTEAIQGMKYEIEMKPGDVLFIPPLWFHQVWLYVLFMLYDYGLV